MSSFLDPLDYSADALGYNGGYVTSSYAGYAIHQLLYTILSGTIGPNGQFQPTDTTGLGGTSLVEALPFPLPNASLTNNPSTQGSNGIQKPVRNLRAAVEELHFNITVGMLSMPYLIDLQNDTATAILSSFDNRWTYNWVQLVAVYGAMVCVTVFAMAVGVRAIISNDGVAVDRSGFLRVLMTTRNPTLDTIVRGRERGEDYMQKEIQGTRVMLGEIVRGPYSITTGRVGFGLETEVAGLRDPLS